MPEVERGVGVGTDRSVSTGRATATGRARATRISVATATDRERVRQDEGDDVADLGGETGHLDSDDLPDVQDADVEIPRDDEPVDDEVREPEPHRGAVPRPAITIWMSPHGVPEWHVRSLPLAALMDPARSELAQARMRRLRGYATQLADLTGPDGRRVAGARDLAELYDALPVVRGKDFARGLGRSDSEVSKDSELLVRMPAGTVTLSFFLWKNSSDATVAALFRHPGVETAAPGDLDAELTAQGFGNVEKHLRWVRAVLRYPRIVSGYHARYRRDPREADQLVKQLTDALAPGTTTTKRSSATLHRALAGAVR